MRIYIKYVTRHLHAVSIPVSAEIS